MEEALNNPGDRVTQPADASQPVTSRPSAGVTDTYWSSRGGRDGGYA